MEKEIKAATRKGIRALALLQKKNGSFMCSTTTVFDDYKKAKFSPAIVPTNIVLSSLVNIPGSKKIKDKAAKFLLTQKGKYWSFNYWQRNSKEFKEIPYPDDLDDTFCALSALYEHCPKIFKGDVMGKITTLLTGTEIKAGGPYNMWLSHKGSEKWTKIDLAVNANIAYFLQINGVTLPNLNNYIEKCIKERTFEFPYYTIYPAIYFISRFYKGRYVNDLIKVLLEKKEADGKWENPMRTALAISSLLNLSNQEQDLDKSVRYLLSAQRKDGTWDPSSFYCELKRKEFTLHAGSSSITTALCLEALGKYQLSKKKGAVIVSDNSLYDKVLSEADEKISRLMPELAQSGKEVLNKVLKGDKNIVLISDLFLKSLGKSMEEKTLIKLSLANLYGWMAYTVYDDFLDGEGNPGYLPIANVCLRDSQSELEAVLNDKEFTGISRKIFDEIDGANKWEFANCRTPDLLPDFGDLSIIAQKSMGHALGPVAILFAFGYKDIVPKVLKFFKHYLIARQLNDDAHDWQEDLKNRIVTPVVAMLLSEKKNQELGQIFWGKTILKVTKEMSKHIRSAEGIINNLDIVSDKKLLLSLLDPIKYSISKAKNDRKQTIKFINTYQV